MTRRLTLLFSAFEALLVAGLGIAIPLVPLTVLWGVQFGFGPSWMIFWRAAVDTWLIGHGVDIRFTLDAATAAALGLPGAASPVVVTIAALGFALLTVLLGIRAGARIAETGHRVLGWLTAVAVFGAISAAVTLSVLQTDARPSIWQGALLPAAVYGGAVAVALVRSLPADHGVRAWMAHRPVALRAIVREGLRAGTAAVALTLSAAAVLVALLVLLGYGEEIRIYESLHAGVIGGIALTAGQLALLPNLVIWASDWLVGPGFAIGLGSSVSPLGTSLGPIPAIPILGALPTGSVAFGFVGLIVPMIAGFLAGAAIRPAMRRALGPAASWWSGALIALLGGVTGGALLGGLAWAAAGSAGPGRLVQVGADPLAVGLWAAVELAIAIGIGLAAGGVVRREGAERSREDSTDTAPILVAARR